MQLVPPRSDVPIPSLVRPSAWRRRLHARHPQAPPPQHPLNSRAPATRICLHFLRFFTCTQFVPLALARCDTLRCHDFVLASSHMTRSPLRAPLHASCLLLLWFRHATAARDAPGTSAPSYPTAISRPCLIPTIPLSRNHPTYHTFCLLSSPRSRPRGLTSPPWPHCHFRFFFCPPRNGPSLYRCRRPHCPPQFLTCRLFAGHSRTPPYPSCPPHPRHPPVHS